MCIYMHLSLSLRPQLQENIKMHNINPWVVLNLLNLHLKTTKDAFAL
jgi:hypothetical protein